jgi:16S rRNA (cytidine1402-2'-O)-methyltransferase
VVLFQGRARAAEPALAEAGLDDRLRAALRAGRSVRDASAEVAGETGLPRRLVYRRALAVAGESS